MDYKEKLKDPRWQRKRLGILDRDKWKCCYCGDDEATLHVHHLKYFPKSEPWDIDDKYLLTLCELCHESETINRKEEERQLLETLRELQFSNSDILNIKIGLYNATKKIALPPEVIATCIEWVLSSTDIESAYFEYLQKRSERIINENLIKEKDISK